MMRLSGSVFASSVGSGSTTLGFRPRFFLPVASSSARRCSTCSWTALALLQPPAPTLLGFLQALRSLRPPSPSGHPLAGRDRNGRSSSDHPLLASANMRCTSSSMAWWLRLGPAPHWLTFVPSRATTPSFTRPASWHNSSRLAFLRSPKGTDGTEAGLHLPREHGLCAWNVDPGSRRTTGWPPSFLGRCFR